MIFDKEETKNLLNMLRSSDTENATIAFEALKGVDTKKYIGELITLYKFSKHNLNEWIVYCPIAGEAIKEAVKLFAADESSGVMSTGTCLSAIVANKSSNQAIELFMELFTDSMIGFLGQMGYPADQFEINVKLKDGQATKS
jgi:hypothetical protein